MTVVVALSRAAKARADEAVRSGRYSTLIEIVQAALADDDESWMDETVDLDDLSPEDRAAVEEGLADIEAGRVYPADQVFTELRARIQAMRG